MRTTYLVCYDITEAKRLRRVFKVCKNYGDHLQFSVFECDLNAAEKAHLEAELSTIINHASDQVIFVTLGPAEGRGGPGHHRIGVALPEDGLALLRLLNQGARVAARACNVPEDGDG